MHNLANLLEIAKQAFQSGENVTLQLSNLNNNVMNNQQIIEFAYELQAGTYIDAVTQNPTRFASYFSDIIEILDQFLETDETVLDIGTGELTTISAVLPKVKTPIKKVLACDISWSRLFIGQKYAQKKLKSSATRDIQLFCADMRAIPLPDNSVDTIISCHALEPNFAGAEQIISELYRVARKRLILFEPSYEQNTIKGQKRMQNLKYIRNLKSLLTEPGGQLVMFDKIHSLNPLNPTYCHVVNLNKEFIGRKEIKITYTVPGSNHKLRSLNEFFLFSKNLGVAFPILQGIPILTEKNAILASKL